MKRNYKEESEKLIKAIDIALVVFKDYPPLHHMTATFLEHTIKCYEGWKEDLLNPKPQYENLGSLKYHIDDVFTYFNESGGEAVEQFWGMIKEAELDYVRENRVLKVLKRKKIKDRQEYEYVTDVIIPFAQQQLITEEEELLLKELLGQFEKKHK